MKVIRQALHGVAAASLVMAAPVHAAGYTAWDISASGLIVSGVGDLNDRGQILAVPNDPTPGYNWLSDATRQYIADASGTRIRVTDFEGRNSGPVTWPGQSWGNGLSNAGHVGITAQTNARPEGELSSFVTGTNGSPAALSGNWASSSAYATRTGLHGSDANGLWTQVIGGPRITLAPSVHDVELSERMTWATGTVRMDGQGRLISQAPAGDSGIDDTLSDTEIFVNLTPGGPIERLQLPGWGLSDTPLGTNRSMTIGSVSNSGLVSGVIQSYDNLTNASTSVLFVFDLNTLSFQRLINSAPKQNFNSALVNSAGDVVYGSTNELANGDIVNSPWQLLRNGQTQAESLDAIGGLPNLISRVYAFNDAGQILVGTGDPGNPLLINGEYLLNPVPEPGTFALMALGLGLVGATARRRRAH